MPFSLGPKPHSGPIPSSKVLPFNFFRGNSNRGAVTFGVMTLCPNAFRRIRLSAESVAEINKVSKRLSRRRFKTTNPTKTRTTGSRRERSMQQLWLTRIPKASDITRRSTYHCNEVGCAGLAPPWVPLDLEANLQREGLQGKVRQGPKHSLDCFRCIHS